MRKKVKFRLWILVAIVISSCAVIREDIVFSERFIESSCTQNQICDLGANVISLIKERVVSAGVAKNSVGTLKSECKQLEQNFLCRSYELVVPEASFQPTQTTRTLSRIYDGYDSDQKIIDLGGCKALTTSQNQNTSYLTVESYFNFAAVIKSETTLVHGTGGLLEDFTEITFVCANECNYDAKSNSSTNIIRILLSENSTSGRLSQVESNKRMMEINNLQDSCSSL